MRQALIAGWLGFVVMMLGASPAHFWLDSGEIAAAGVELGVIHPPGAPGYTLMLRAASLLPVGTLGFRLALLSSALAAVAVAGVFALLRTRDAHPWTCWAMALWMLGGWTFLRHGRTVEIYALAAALLVVVLWGFDPLAPRSKRCARRLIGTFAAVWASFCFGDLRLALVVPVVLGWVWSLRRGHPWAAWAPTVVVAATCILLTIPLASVTGPVSDWGDPETAATFWSHLQADSIRSAYGEEILPRSAAMWQHNLQAFAAQLSEDLGPPGLVLATIALVALWVQAVGRGGKDRPSRRRGRCIAVAAAMSWVVLVEVVYAVGINPMGIADRQTGMVLAPVAALAVGEQLRRMLGERRALRWAVVPLVATVLVLPAAIVSFDDRRATASWVPHAWTRKALSELPPGTLLLTQSDDLSAGVAAARTLEGARPDLVSIPGQHLYKPAPQWLERRPGLVQAWQRARAAPTEAERIERFAERWQGPVALEHPSIAVFKHVRMWPEHVSIPVRWTGPATVRPLPPIEEARRSIEYWVPRLQSRPGRERLATALANHARGLARVRGDIDAAASVLEMVLTRVTAHHPGTLVALAALQDFGGETDRAIELTRRALLLEPGRSVALTNLALYLSRDPATLDEALHYAQRAAALRPWRRDVWLRLAYVYERRGEMEAAARAGERAQAL